MKQDVTQRDSNKDSRTGNGGFSLFPRRMPPRARKWASIAFGIVVGVGMAVRLLMEIW